MPELQRSFLRHVNVTRVAVLTLVVLAMASGAYAAPQPVELILRTASIGQPAEHLSLVESRLIFLPGARWDAVLDPGPLMLSVEAGKVGIVLDDGLAWIDRQVNPLQDRRSYPLDPNQTTILWPGDTLVVIQGHLLRVDNDDDVLAKVAVSRVTRAWPPVVDAVDARGTPR